MSHLAFARDVAIIGGCGHVGLPLALAFASRGLQVSIYDNDNSAVALVNDGIMPFYEKGAQEILVRVATTNLSASGDPQTIATAEHVVLVIGTPVDKHLNPDPRAVLDTVKDLLPFFHDGQLIVLRSTIYPGVSNVVARQLSDAGLNVDVVFCPERIAEGRAMSELFELPQIVGARTPTSMNRAKRLFGVLTPRTIELLPEEAELAKLFTNAWRYLKFAGANQLFEIANNFGMDYERIRQAVISDYPRAADLPSAGFAAGPCLLKDTMQLAAFNKNEFILGHASMMINEGLPLYIVERMDRRWDLSVLTVGVLGMAFKAESDDIRDSLAYKLLRILEFKAHRVMRTDPYVTNDPHLEALSVVLDIADVLVVAAPHEAYRRLKTHKPIVDIWGICDRGVCI